MGMSISIYVGPCAIVRPKTEPVPACACVKETCRKYRIQHFPPVRFCDTCGDPMGEVPGDRKRVVVDPHKVFSHERLQFMGDDTDTATGPMYWWSNVRNIQPLLGKMNPHEDHVEKIVPYDTPAKEIGEFKRAFAVELETLRAAYGEVVVAWAAFTVVR